LRVFHGAGDIVAIAAGSSRFRWIALSQKEDLSPSGHPRPALSARQADRFPSRTRHRHGPGPARSASSPCSGAHTRARSRSQTAPRGAAQDPRRTTAGAPSLGQHPADRVGTPGSRRGTITTVRGVDSTRAGARAENALSSPRGEPLTKLGALSDHQRLIRHRGVAPLIYQYGETVIIQRERQVRASACATPRLSFKTV
jgi:hypothetical protein